MGDKQHYTVDQVIVAVREGRGLMTLAAKRLGCHAHTIRNYRRRYATVAAAMDEALEAQLDLAEAKLYQLIGEGDLGAIRYFLSTRGKHRGYVERQEHRHADADGGPLHLTVTVVDDSGLDRSQAPATDGRIVALSAVARGA